MTCNDLWNDGESGAKIMKSNTKDIDAVNKNLSLHRLHNPKYSQSQRRLPSTGSSNNSDLEVSELVINDLNTEFKKINK